METSTRNKLCAATAALAVECSMSYILSKRRKTPRDATELFDYLTINIVTTEESCDQVCEELTRRCQKHRVLGFDCEWVSKGHRQPVALVQLSSIDGYCGLFRLNILKAMPVSLKKILEDSTIYKVGLAPVDDGQYLSRDYTVKVTSTLDLRHLAEVTGFEPGGLATLSANILGAVLDKNWKVRCSDWEAEELTERQVHYAAIDAHVATRIIAVLLEKLGKKYTVLSWLFGTSFPSVWNNLDKYCSKFADYKFHMKPRVKLLRKNDKEKRNVKRVKDLVPSMRYAPMRQKPLYNNGFLHAPDGELLCTCDTKKAMWFVNKGLAKLLKEDPITIQLNFEPAGRPEGPQRYYTLMKENVCVVCGGSQTYIRKNVVPRDYRKNFPEILKEHSSHDVVLLCGPCHKQSNKFDQTMRHFLADQCDAPMADVAKGKKTYEDFIKKRVRSSARALKYFSNSVPPHRRKYLEDILLQHYPDQVEVTEDLLDEASQIQVVFYKEGFESHGARVVDYYVKNGGLLKLEEMWRRHFLKTMKPKHMPELWSATHSEDSFRERFRKGLITEEDLKPIGLTTL